MTRHPQIDPSLRAASRPGGTLASPFGVPLGNLGWITSLIMAIATGFAAFFLATFVSIVVLLIVSTAAHHPVDYAMSYRRIGFPIGAAIGASALAYLGLLWTRRVLGRA